MKNKIINRINPKTGNYYCNGKGEGMCGGREITGGLAAVINGLVYCTKCADIALGIRDKHGRLIENGNQVRVVQ